MKILFISIFLSSFISKAAVETIGDADKINRSLSEPFSVPVTHKDRKFSLSFAQNFNFNPNFSNEQTAYDKIYGEKASTGIFVANTWYLLESDYFSIGPHVGLGIITDKDNGWFAPSSGARSEEAREMFHITHVPLEVGVSGMLSALKYVVPFGTISGLAMGVYEKRDDGEKSHRGLGWGIGYEFGAGLWLNFLERAAAWALDYNWSINNTYLFVSNKGINTFGDLEYSENLFTAGLTFEY